MGRGVRVKFNGRMKEMGGYKICTKCGAAFKASANRNTLCKCCSKEANKYNYKHCEVCGTRFRISNKDRNSCRCESCQKEFIKKYDRDRK